MKRLLVFTLALSFACFVKAQFFVGGNLGLTYNKGAEKSITTNGEKETYTRPNTLGFNISPLLGYYINDRMSVALVVDFGYTHTSSFPNDGAYMRWLASKYDYFAFIIDITPELQDKLGDENYSGFANEITFGISPSFRYAVPIKDKLYLFTELQLAFIEAHLNTERSLDISGEHQTYTSNDLVKQVSWGVQLCPGITYMLSNKISVDMYLNLLQIGYSSAKETINNSVTTVVSTASDWTFGLCSLPKVFTIGFTYNL